MPDGTFLLSSLYHKGLPVSRGLIWFLLNFEYLVVVILLTLFLNVALDLWEVKLVVGDKIMFSGDEKVSNLVFSYILKSI